MEGGRSEGKKRKGRDGEDMGKEEENEKEADSNETSTCVCT